MDLACTEAIELKFIDLRRSNEFSVDSGMHFKKL